MEIKNLEQLFISEYISLQDENEQLKEDVELFRQAKEVGLIGYPSKTKAICVYIVHNIEGEIAKLNTGVLERLHDMEDKELYEYLINTKVNENLTYVMTFEKVYELKVEVSNVNDKKFYVLDYGDRVMTELKVALGEWCSDSILNRATLRNMALTRIRTEINKAILDRK